MVKGLYYGFRLVPGRGNIYYLLYFRIFPDLGNLGVGWRDFESCCRGDTSGDIEPFRWRIGRPDFYYRLYEFDIKWPGDHR